MKIKDIYNVACIENRKFREDVFKHVKMLQEDGQKVEIQYQTSYTGGGAVLYSALILGKAND